MEYIAHRINTIEALKALDRPYGVELDLRDEGGELILSHDPFSPGESFEAFLEVYCEALSERGTLILNIKSERIEWRVLEHMRLRGIERYFFLDSSFPMIYALSEQGERRCAIRFSELEGMDTLRAMAGRVEWVWVDCFTHLPLTPVHYADMRALGYKLCLVSPELQGRPEDIAAYRVQCAAEGYAFDAICTKAHSMALWETRV